MKGLRKPLEIFNVISKCLKDYDTNLKNKKVMFIVENKKRELSKVEVYFPKSCYYHLTGINLYDKNNRRVNSYEFYDLIKSERVNLRQYKIESKDGTTDLKLQVLPQLMKIDRMASMIGNFSNCNMVLQTEKIAGNIHACMGFIKDVKLNIYIPNTVLKKDIRDITDDRGKIVAILKKEMTDDLYKNITYLKQNYQIADILKNEKINDRIDIKNISSIDKNIDKKIGYFVHENNK